MGSKEIGLSSTNLHPGSVSLIPNVSSRVVGVEERTKFGVRNKEHGQTSIEKRFTTPWPRA
jgi:hypothetical protein